MKLRGSVNQGGIIVERIQRALAHLKKTAPFDNVVNVEGNQTYGFVNKSGLEALLHLLYLLTIHMGPDGTSCVMDMLWTLVYKQCAVTPHSTNVVCPSQWLSSQGMNRDCETVMSVWVLGVGCHVH